MATSLGSFGNKQPVAQQNGSNIVNQTSNPRIPPSANGTRIEPKDSYIFVVGSTAIFKATFTDTDKPVQVDTGTSPIAIIHQNGNVLETISGSLVDGQLYEYKFEWDVPLDADLKSSTYTISYSGYKLMLQWMSLDKINLI